MSMLANLMFPCFPIPRPHSQQGLGGQVEIGSENKRGGSGEELFNKWCGYWSGVTLDRTHLTQLGSSSPSDPSNPAYMASWATKGPTVSMNNPNNLNTPTLI